MKVTIIDADFTDNVINMETRETKSLMRALMDDAYLFVPDDELDELLGENASDHFEIVKEEDSMTLKCWDLNDSRYVRKYITGEIKREEDPYYAR